MNLQSEPWQASNRPHTLVHRVHYCTLLFFQFRINTNERPGDWEPGGGLTAPNQASI